MTQYKTVIVPTTFDTSYHSYTVAAEAITNAITEQAKDGWEIAFVQEMDAATNKGFFGNLFGSKKTERNNLLVFKKEDKKPEPEPEKPQEFDYEKFEEIVNKGMDYNKLEGVFKKVVEETEITLSKKSFAGLKISVPVPALPMKETTGRGKKAAAAPAALPLNINITTVEDEASEEKSSEDKKDKKETKANANANASKTDENNLVIAKAVFDVFSENEGKAISFNDVKLGVKGKVPDNTSEEEIINVLNAFVEHKKVTYKKGLYTF